MLNKYISSNFGIISSLSTKGSDLLHTTVHEDSAVLAWVVSKSSLDYGIIGKYNTVRS